MIKDYEIPMPRWELTDPFGRAAIKSLRFDLKKAMCERDGYRVELEETLKARGAAVDAMAAALANEQARANEITRRFQVSEDARKNLGEKLSKLRDELAEVNAARARLRIDLERLRAERDELKKNYEQLQADHETLVQAVTHREEELPA